MDSVIHVGAICNMRAGLLGFLSRPVPHNWQVPEKINHTEISISYKADWSIRSGYLLALITYVTPLSLSMLAHGSVPFSAGQVTCCLFGGLRRSGGGTFLLHSLILFSLPRLYFLSGWPAYTSCLANQRFIKIHDWQNTDNSPAPFPSFFF